MNVKDRFVPVKRIYPDNRVWWVVWDKVRKGYSPYFCHGRYKTRKECKESIDYWNEKVGEEFNKGLLFPDRS